ncbi:heparinase II/III family protein [Aquibium microcysteis]|uniref:heparinase II/III family protein n=1 Tax=Aquibium microcysteis TaxID=675281 RepID=UPI001EF1892F|nr:heparinase II/III family protein [Aquibium microcysteis]
MRRRIGQAVLLWHTVRHLKPVQIGGRAWFRLHRPKPDLAPAPALRDRAGPWVRPAGRQPSQLGPDRFCFLNQEGDLGGGWDDGRRDKLWRYNLHYFDDLNADSAQDRVAWHQSLIRRWVADNPPGVGTGWEPYPTSLRIVNWIKWTLAGNRLPPEAVQSLAVQARWLSRRLEHHLLGNHLFANAKALVFAGSFFTGDEPARWLSRAATILKREIPEQILDDGGHFELSTMYHALALEDALDLENLWRAYPDSRRLTAGIDGLVAARIAPMRRWLTAMCHPDGEIAFFNDSAFGVAPPPAALDAYASRLGLDPIGPGKAGLLRDSGYARLEAGPSVVLADVARVGPDYLPGHAHADTLSFELSVGWQRVLVNSGTSVYAAGPERLRQRGTAAHNTVVIAGENSSEIWSAFRVARRARPFDLSIEDDGSTTVLACSHDGYTRLARGAVHRRTLILQPGGLTVEDVLAGGADPAEARFHFHPSWDVAVDGAHGRAVSDRGQVVAWVIEAGTASIQAGTHHPEFGISLPSACLVVGLEAGRSLVRFTWSSVSSSSGSI